MRIAGVTAAVVSLLALTAAPSGAYEVGSVDIVVKVSADASTAGAASGTGGQVTKTVSDDTVVLSVPSDNAEEAAARVATRPGVEWAEPDIVYSAAVVPNDPCLSSCDGFTQWGPAKIGAPTAWDVTRGNKDYSIAILDSGVDINHPDLAGRVVRGPNYSFDATQEDQYGHGTHVAGIAGAATNNGVGVAGMVWNASMVSVKVLDRFGDGSASGVAQGLRWVADNGYRIANMSLGGGQSNTLAEAVTYAQSKGVLVVAAAQNFGVTTEYYPAAYNGVISVGSSEQDDTLSSFSNRGRWVDLLAPGSSIVSTFPGGGYQNQSGTSMATPYVAAAASLLWSHRPYLTDNAVRQRFLDTATQVSGSGSVVLSGRLDVGAALGNPQSTGYRLAATDGGIFSYDAPFSGSTGSMNLFRPIVDTVNTANSGGYWLVASDGGVFSFGGAQFYGSTGGRVLNAEVVAGAAARSGRGYWLVASDGGVFSFGDARFYGSTGGQRINSPIVDIVPTASGRGYWLVASDGGVFSFGDAAFYGSAGSIRLNAPIVGAARSATGRGYWLVASDGGVFSYGDAMFHGSTGSRPINAPIVAIAPTQNGGGYWFGAADGGVFSFGNATFHGSAGGVRLNRPVVAMEALG